MKALTSALVIAAAVLLLGSTVCIAQTVVFSDNFDDNAIDLNQWTIDRGSWTETSGELRIAGTEGTIWADGLQCLTDYTITLRARYISGYGFRVFFRNDWDGGFYIFAYDVRANTR